MTVVQERRNRQTGTVVQVWDRGVDEPDQRWETICVDHGGVCSHDTRALAMGWAAEPLMWCEDCQKAESGLTCADCGNPVKAEDQHSSPCCGARTEAAS